MMLIPNNARGETVHLKNQASKSICFDEKYGLLISFLFKNQKAKFE